MKPSSSSSSFCSILVLLMLALSLLGPAVDGARIGAASSLRGSTSKSPMNRVLRRLTPILRKEIVSSGGGRRKNSNKGETRDEGEETVLELGGGDEDAADTAGKTKAEDVNKEASQQTEQSEKSADDKIII